MISLYQEYRIINECIWTYNRNNFTNIGRNVSRPQAVQNLMDIIKDLYDMEVEVKNATRDLRITITLTV